MNVNQRLHSRRRPLIKDRTAVYHVISRATRDEFLFDEREKEVFRAMLWKLAAFHGVEILTYCVMSNHFHLLLRIPHQETISDQELLERYRVRYAGTNRPFSAPSPEVIEAVFIRDDEEAAYWRQRLSTRMGSLPVFMRELKTSFCIWYNHTHQNHGTIWAERYKSLIVEDAPQALNIVAAYIDLNPVRAKLADDPAEYRWCGYAEAAAGTAQAKAGICTRFTGGNREWKHAVAAYRTILFGKGRKAKGTSGKDQGRVSPEAADKVQDTGGEITLAESLRRKVRYFTDGMVLGSQKFLDGYFENNRRQFGPKRKSGPRRMKGAEWGELRVMRQLGDAVE